MSNCDRLRCDVRGAAQVEFLIAFVPIFLLSLGIAQYALLVVGQLVVEHAAWAGVRAAIVILDDDPAHYDEPVGVLSPDDAGDRSELDALLVTQLGMGKLPSSPLPARRGGSRLAAIRRAVSRPLSVLAPDAAGLAARLTGDARDSLGQALGSDNFSRLGVGLGIYNDWAAAVTFPRGRGATDLYEQAVPPEASAITLRVTYLFRCGVPLVSALMCDALSGRGGRASPRTSVALAELDRVPSPLGLAALLAGGGYFRVLRAEATLPRQDATYSYATGG